MWKLIAILLAVTLTQDKCVKAVRDDWWNTALFYQIYTRSFKDSNEDGVGDINGITSKLDYLKELGVDVIILTPIYKSPMNDFGFDVSDYYSVQPEYGNMTDFEQLLSKSNDINIKVILDLVPNHTSNESEWFTKSSSRDEYYSDWYVWGKGHVDSQFQRQPPNNWVSVFRKSAWTYMPSRDEYYLHQFGTAQPDLNLRNPVVVEEIRNIIKFWLEKGVAGFRISSVNHFLEVDKEVFGGRYPDEPLNGKPGAGPDDYSYLDHTFTKDLDENYELVSQLREVFDSITVRDNMIRVMMTEACTGIKNAVKYYGEGTHRGAHIPINFALLNDLDKDSDARDMKYAIDRWMTYKPLKKSASWMTGNHDKSRVASRFRPELIDAFNMIVLLLPGIAITYMGEEIGMTNGFVPWVNTKDPLACNTDDPVNFGDVSRDPVRTPFQWSSGKNADRNDPVDREFVICTDIVRQLMKGHFAGAAFNGFSQADKTWLPLADGFDYTNVMNERIAVRSHFQVYRALAALRRRQAFKIGRYTSLTLNRDVFAFKRWHNDDTYVVVINFGKAYHVVNLTVFDLVFGQMEVEVSSVLSSRSFGDNVQANYLDLAADEALVLRMQA